MNKPLKVLTALALTVSLTTTTFNSAEASSNKVMWGKTELKSGQIGKVTILKDTPLFKLNNDGTLTTVRTLKKGDEFRAYQYKVQHGVLYGVGSGSFIQKNSDSLKYETPSKSRLALVKKNQKTDIIATPVKPTGKDKGIYSASHIQDLIDSIPLTMYYEDLVVRLAEIAKKLPDVKESEKQNLDLSVYNDIVKHAEELQKNGVVKEPIIDPSAREEIKFAFEGFKKVLGETYVISVVSENILASRKAEIHLQYSNLGGKHHLEIQNKTSIATGYSVMKEIGFPLDIEKFNNILSLAETTGQEVEFEGITILKTGQKITFKW